MSDRPASPRRHPVEFDQVDDYGAPHVEHLGAPSRPNKARRLALDLLSRWYWIVLGVVLGLLVSAYYLSKTPEKFTATATLLIKQRTMTAIGGAQVEDIDMASTEGLNTVAARLGRPELLERVASRIDVRSLPGLIPPKVDWTPDWLAARLGRAPKAVADKEPASAGQVPAAPVLGGMLGSWMRISIREGTRLLDVSITHQVPEVSKALADAVVREYLADISGTATEGRSSKLETLMRQSEEARVKLQVAEEAMANYNRTLELHAALDQMENEVTKLSRRYLPKHPKMIVANGELESLKNRFLTEFDQVIHSSADGEYWKTIAEQINAAREDPEQYLRVARQLLLARTGVLSSEIASRSSVFKVMLTRIEESSIEREGQESSAEVSSLARVPGGPSSPNRKQAQTQGVMMGGAAGLLLAFVLVRMDNKYHTVAQLESETGQPILAAISDIQLGHLLAAEKHQAKHRKPGENLEASPLQASWDPRLVFRPSISDTNFAEMFRVLRASITLLGDEPRRKITMFSSALPGEGKSMVSANFALAAAGQGRRTILVDLDLRKPSVHRLFGHLRSEIGLGATEWLAGQASLDQVILKDVGCQNLHVITAGQRAPNPGELLNTNRLKELFELLSNEYEVIVLDSAPLLAVPDSRVIAPLVDNFCLVVRSDYVPKGALSRTMELLNAAGSPPSGLVFNGYKEVRRMLGQNYSYGNYRLSRYGSASHYSYGSYGSDDHEEDDEMKRRKKKPKRKQKS